MSRLTASPFHKPSPFEFPRVPLSPPETNSDRTGPSPLAPTTISVLGGTLPDPHHLDSEPAHRSQSPENAGARFRRVSTLAYHNSTLRETRERTVQRASKSFVVVIPPSTFLREHGQLGHTLALGPRHRLSQGVLMPLFPTMYGQLTAIAREYNFPSISGLCLYLHFTENGINATPRVSDDTWQLIWSNVFDASVPPQRIPIVGKIEFDIDLRYARWFPSWMSSSQREQLDVPASVVPSTAPSVAHYRGDSRTTDLEINMNMNDEQIDSNSVSPQSAVPTTRHVPRKLSLVDRLDSSLRPASRPSSRPTSSPREAEQLNPTQVLSPIFQEDEPKTAKLDTLETRVNTWRASASLTPTALAVRGQTSLEPANLPNTMTLEDVASGVDEDELNLEDFTWSVSSLGPNDWEEGTILSWDRLPSVHLANRLEGSVCLTPSDCTSFGPSDYTLPSPVPSMERILTPDIANRMYEDVPFTPSTATSWGPPSEYPPSPMSLGRASSVDIGERLVFSRPPTPTTATSWGPGSWPPTPATPYYVRTPDVGQRSFDLDDIEIPVTAPWGHVWPYISLTSDVPSTPWNYVWPHTSSAAAASESFKISAQPPCVYPSLNIYPAVYPHFNLYPAEPSRTEPVAYPNFDLYPTVNTSTRRTVMHFGNSLVTYPNFDLYPAVYPSSLDITYPPPPIAARNTASRTSGYPDFDIYRSLPQVPPKTNVVKAVSWSYPTFDLYPAVHPYVPSSPSGPENGIQQASRFDTWNYPIFDLYPAVYPHVTPYPPGLRLQIADLKATLTGDRVFRSQGYPDFEIYPTVSGNIKKTVKSTSGYPVFDLYPAVSPRIKSYSSAKLSATRAASHFNGYPDFDLYPSIDLLGTRANSRSCGYPDFDLYPSTGQSVKQATSHFYGYPDFNIYPSAGPSVVRANSRTYGYPDFDIYPSGDLSVTRALHFYGYPDFNIYPPVDFSTTPTSSHSYGYPNFDIYPPVKSSVAQAAPAFCSSGSLDKKSAIIVVELLWGYPIIDLYPAVYPHLIPYPSMAAEIPVVSKTADISGYPEFNLYPCRGYPYFDLYSSHPREQPVQSVTALVESATRYPVIDLYPAVYPNIVPYPSMITVVSAWPETTLPSVLVTAPAHSRKRLTHAELHAMVMLEKSWSQISPKVHRSHRSLHDEVFANGMMSTPSGNTMETYSTVHVLPVRPVGRIRSGSIANRPLSAATPPPARGLPPRPNYQTQSAGSEVSRTSQHVQRKVNHVDSVTVASTLQSSDAPASSQTKQSARLTPESLAPVESGPSTVGPPIGTPLRRAVSSASRPLVKKTAVSHLAPVDETSPALARSSSMTSSSRANDSGSILAPPRRRESLVLQRARAFESNDDASRISMATLKEFPLPPRPNVPSVPSRHSFLERSKPS